ncbi:lipid-A-disaccharide synthase N-terminal domain-containing protein [Syntrophobacter fumaroxidans]|uniref:Lipid A biosynthesis domain protein n=1 Tax=Syntrophobacter fumaroxidans (strain DSM 10017 / MPOB) TaxID=335543 RepID=A0LMY4_SYNFM|nr:lipid-A-disaccharide synthase N-terminal domain-containing protein [Syntrophobacter fumaroxidans]ABK18786.1 lipid A biosynthesis domain protein [Syntrophobacter fumaroxidans MPOB]
MEKGLVALKLFPQEFMSAETGILFLGFVAQGLFSARFLVQWIVSERQGRSVVPMAFWYLSVAGGGLLLIYAVIRRDPVFILGQASGLVVYGRNIYLIYRERGRKKKEAESGTT